MPNGEGINALLMLKEHAPERLAAAKEERQRLVERVLELSIEIAQLETVILVGQSLDAGVTNGKAVHTEPDQPSD